MSIDASAEQRHRPSDTPTWSETWSVECVTEDAALGIRMELRLQPGLRRAQCSMLLVRADHGVVWLHEENAPVPRSGLEVRASGLWMQFIAQEPLEHFTVDLEAFAVELDDPSDASGTGYGRRVPVACELEWQSRGAPEAIAGGYKIPAFVMGEFQIEQDEIQIDGWGWRLHTWGDDVPVDAFRGRSHDATWSPEAGLGLVVGWGIGLDGAHHRLVETEGGVGWRSIAAE